MYITYDKYRFFGYSAVSEEEFPKYCAEACAAVDFFTFSRIRAGELDDKAVRGICEITELVKKRRGEDSGSLAGFSNEGYSESYKSGGNKNKTEELYAEIFSVITLWFDLALLSRGI